MKILHFADVHIGHENYGRTDEKTGLNTRLLDFLRSFDKIVNYALNNDIDLVVFAGDAYKTRDPSPTYQREFGKRIKKIASKIPIVLVTGNHDIPPSFGKADTLEIFPTLEVPNVYVFSKPGVYQLPTTNRQLPTTKYQIPTTHYPLPTTNYPLPTTHYPLPITILALPWIPRSTLIKEEDRKKPIEKIKEILSARITQIFSDLLDKIDPQKPAIAVVHQSVTGATYASGQETYLGNDPLIPISVLSNPKLSYVALGHLHKFQVLNEQPPVIYPGSIERIDFGEEIEEKGFVVATLLGPKTKWQFIPLPARKFKTINIQLPEGESQPNEFVKKEIEKAEIKDAIIRINLLGKESILAKIIDSDLKELTKDAFWVASISKKSEKQITKMEINNEVLGPMEWFNRYLESKKFSKEEKKILSVAALRLMDEVGGLP